VALFAGTRVDEQLVHRVLLPLGPEAFAAHEGAAGRQRLHGRRHERKQQDHDRQHRRDHQQLAPGGGLWEAEHFASFIHAMPQPKYRRNDDKTGRKAH
jgi:hypothetical protein